MLGEEAADGLVQDGLTVKMRSIFDVKILSFNVNYNFVSNVYFDITFNN